MIHVVRQKKRFPVIGLLASAVLIAACLYLFTVGTGSVAQRTKEENLNALVEAVRRASVQCYAIEGRYPPSVEYLEDHYGISIDRNAYNVFYSGWASNIMPDITIIPIEEEDE